MGQLRSPSGEIVTIPDDQVEHAIAGGYVPVSTTEAGQTTGAIEHEDTGALGAVGAGLSSLASGATLGLSDLAAKGLLNRGHFEDLALQREQHPIVSGLGNVAGAILPSLVAPGSTLATAPAGLLSRAAAGATEQFGGGLAAKAVVGAAEGAMYNAGAYLSDTALGDRDLTAEGLSGALGAGFAFGTAGAVGMHGVEAGTIAARRMFARIADGGGKAALEATSAWERTSQSAMEANDAAAEVARAKLAEAKLATQQAGVARDRAAATVATERSIAPEVDSQLRQATALDENIAKVEAAEAAHVPEPGPEVVVGNHDDLARLVAEHDDARAEFERALASLQAPEVGQPGGRIEKIAGKFGEPELAAGTPAPMSIRDALDARARQVEATSVGKRPAGAGQSIDQMSKSQLDAFQSELDGKINAAADGDPGRQALYDQWDQAVARRRALSGEAPPPPPPKSSVADHVEAMDASAFDRFKSEFATTLTPEERDAALAYSGGSHASINRPLRTGDRELSDRYVKIIDNLDSMFGHASTPHDMTVIRGEQSDRTLARFRAMKPGEVYTDKGYLSTTVASRMPKEFDGNVEMRVRVPAGSKAAPIPALKSGERELLLSRNQRYRLDSSTYDEAQKKLIVHVTAIGDGAARAAPASNSLEALLAGTKAKLDEGQSLGEIAGGSKLRKDYVTSKELEVGKPLTRGSAEHGPPMHANELGWQDVHVARDAPIDQLSQRQLKKYRHDLGDDLERIFDASGRDSPEFQKLNKQWQAALDRSAEIDYGHIPNPADWHPSVPGKLSKADIEKEMESKVWGTPEYAALEKQWNEAGPLATAATKPIPAGPAPFGDRLDAAFDRLDAKGDNTAKLHDLRAEFPDLTREQFDAEIRKLRVDKQFRLEEGSLSPAEMESGIKESGQVLPNLARHDNYKTPADRVVDDMAKEWSSGLPKGASDALQKYALETGEGSYGPINRALRAGDDMPEKMLEQVELIDKSFRPTPQKVTVFRGLSAKHVEGLQVGDVMKDDAFVSTSTQEGAPHLLGKGKRGSTILRISVPEGHPIAPISAINSDVTEREILLPRGTRLRIVEVPDGPSQVRGGFGRSNNRVIDAVVEPVGDAALAAVEKPGSTRFTVKQKDGPPVPMVMHVESKPEISGTGKRVTVTVKRAAKDGEILEAGSAEFFHRANGEMYPNTVNVDPPFHRLGIASRMYKAAEEAAGGKIIPSQNQTKMGEAFSKSFRGARDAAAESASKSAAESAALEGLLRGTKQKIDEGASFKDISPGDKTSHFDIKSSDLEFDPKSRTYRDKAGASSPLGFRQAPEMPRDPALEAAMRAADEAHPFAAKQLEQRLDAAHELAVHAPDAATRESALAEAATIERQLTAVGARPGAVEDAALMAPIATRYEKASAAMTEALGDAAPPAARAQAQAFRAAEDNAERKTMARTTRAIDDANEAPVQVGRDRRPSAMKSSAERINAAKQDKLKADAALAQARAGESEAKLGAQAASLAAKAAPAAKPGALPAVGGALGKLRTVGTALEVASDFGVPGVPHPKDIPVVGPLLSVYLKYRAIKAAAGRFTGRVPATAEARAAALAARTKDKIARAVDQSLGLVERAAKSNAGQRGAVAASARVGSTLARRAFDDGEPDAPKDATVQQQAAVRIREIANAATQPQLVIAQVRREMRGVVDPDLIEAAEKHQVALYQWLNGKAPKAPPPNPFSTKPWEPSLALATRFARMLGVAQDPHSAFESLAKQTLTPEEAETFQRGYPRLFGMAQARMIERAADVEHPIPYQQKLRNGLLFDAPLDPSMAPGTLSLLQTAHVASSPGPAASPAAPPGAPPAPPVPALAAPTNLTALYQTAQDRRAMR